MDAARDSGADTRDGEHMQRDSVLKPMASFTRHVLAHIGDRRVLDIGCNNGIYLRHFPPGSVGLDLNMEHLRACKSQGLECLRLDLGGYGLPFNDGAFKCVFFSHVLEHIENPLAMLREVSRVLETGGDLILGLPGEKNMFRFLLRDEFFRGHPGHLYGFSVENAKELLRLTGFSPYRTYFDAPVFRGVDPFHWLPGGLKERLFPSYWVLARKK